MSPSRCNESQSITWGKKYLKIQYIQKIPTTPKYNKLYLTLQVFDQLLVKNVSKQVFQNLLAFFAAILCILMGFLVKIGFQSTFDDGKLTSKEGPPIEKWKFYVAQT